MNGGFGLVLDSSESHHYHHLQQEHQQHDQVMNGGFGLVLDGSESAAGRARSMLGWDVSNGVARF